MKRILLVAASAVLVAAEKSDHPTGPRITPPTLNVVTPRGVARGMTVEMTLEGLNLARAGAIYFSEPGVTGRILRVKELPDLPDIRLGSNGTPSTIDLGPLPPRNQVTVEVEVSPDAMVGEVKFRLQTPVGTSPEGSFLIEPYYGESPDREPNDTPENAFETYLPTILVGTITRPGDLDHYKITAKGGEQIIFEDGGAQIGSTLSPVVSILTPEMNVIAEYGREGRGLNYFAHKFDKGGVYYIRVGDYQQSGRGSHTYRIKTGEFPLATSAWPMGVENGKTAQVAVRGFHLGAGKAAVKGEPSPEDEDAVILRPEAPSGASFSKVKLALGREPEVDSSGTNLSKATAQAVSTPVTVNGRIAVPQGSLPEENYFRFRAKKGEKVVLEVNARRLGSELDSMVEVLDAAGNPVEQATVRSVLETFTTLRDHDSASGGIRITQWTGFAAGDYMMLGSEILKIEALPRTPDDDMRFESFGGQRIAYFNTSSEAHAIDKAVYKVQIHPPGVKFTPNGLPLVRLYYRNDDGGPGYGKDSLIRFTAPADGEYLARIRDVRGAGGDDHGYRLTIRPPRPNFRLSVTPRNPNVPAGGHIPLTLVAFRMDDFDDPIEVKVEDLPPGITATPGVIGKGQVSATILLSAAPDARLAQAAPLRVVGRAQIGGALVAHVANTDDKLKLISLMPKPDILVTAETREVVLEPGGTADVALSIARQNGFGGRVPVRVLNLPPRVRVLDVGLNGVLFNEDENRRSFTLEALASAEPMEQVIWVAGDVETRSPLQSQFASAQPILLKVKAAQSPVSRPVGATERSSAPR